MVWWSMVLLMVVSLTACTRADEPGSAQQRTPEMIASAAPQGTPDAAARATPASVADAEAEEDEGDEGDDDDDFDQPWSDFEIDADASSYTGYVPKQVAFVAKALNGTPPFKFDWAWGDGSPPESGESLVHTFTKVGRIDVFVTGTDGEGRTSKVQLVLFLISAEDHAQRNNIDPATLPTLVLPSPTPKP